MTNYEIAELVIESGCEMTTNPYEAIYLLTDGQMIGGEFDSGVRGCDHNMISILLPAGSEMNEYDYAHELGLVRLVPETEYALINEGQELSQIQAEIIEDMGYTIEAY